MPAHQFVFIRPALFLVKQRAKLSSLGVETASKSFHPGM
jgi:hypothetical protein